jgi:hypothetical protein
MLPRAATIRFMGRKRANESDGEKAGPNRTGKAIHVYVKPNVRTALDDYLASLTIKPKITAVVEVALERFLEAEGFKPEPKK